MLSERPAPTTSDHDGKDRYISDPTFVDVPVARLLNQQYAAFSLHPRHAQPGKRTMHTLPPAMMLRENTPYMATMGEDTQPQIHVQLCSAMIDFELNRRQAISTPCWCSRHCPPIPAEGLIIEQGGQSDVDKHLSKTITKKLPTCTAVPSHLVGSELLTCG
jgi:gamma-glutamyltranspeptidase